MAKKSLEEKLEQQLTNASTFNPLLSSLRENDKKNLFSTNAVTYFHKTGFPLFDYFFGSVANIHDELGRVIDQQPRLGQAAGTMNMIIGNTGSGKALPNSTPIPSPDSILGYKYMGQLQVGDRVYNRHGEPITVIGVFPQGEKAICSVITETGRTARCSPDHLWTYRMQKPDGSYIQDTVTTTELYKLFRNSGPCTIMLPVLHRPISYNGMEVDADLYTQALIFNSNPRLHDDILIVRPRSLPVRNYLKDRFKHTDTVAGIETDCDEIILGRVNDILDMDYTIRVDRRRLPMFDMNINASESIKLLMGIADAGGLSHDEPQSKVLFNVDTELVGDILYLARSLGFKARSHGAFDDRRTERVERISIDMTVAEFNQFTYENSKPKGFVSPFCTERIECDLPVSDEWETIECIELLKLKEGMTCIKVDDPEELFLTEDFIATHNTTLAIQLATNIMRQYDNANVIHFDCEQRMDLSRVENVSKIPAEFMENGRYILKSGLVGLDTLQETVVKLYAAKMHYRSQLAIKTDQKDEFGRPIEILPPSIIIIDSISTVISETFSPDNAKELSDVMALSSNTEGARNAKTIKGFCKDILPLCKEANIIVYFINHINSNMSMNSFTPPTKQQNFLKVDESIPGGRVLLYYPYNIIKLIAKPSDDFNESRDGFNGHLVTIEPVKSSSNQSGNSSKGVYFDMVFSFKDGFDSLRSLILYGRANGIIDGNAPRLSFKEDPSFTFAWKAIDQEKDDKPIWDCVKKYIIPRLNEHLSYIEPSNLRFDNRLLDY